MILLFAGGAGTLCVRGGMVAVSGIHYHPPAGKPEYFILENLTTTPLDMADWKVSEGVHYTFPAFTTNHPTATLLKSRERLVIASDSEIMVRAAHKIPASVRILGPWTGKLSDTGERITIRDRNGVPMCSLKYGVGGDWPADSGGNGESIGLAHPNGRLDVGRNWTVRGGFDSPPATANSSPLSLASTVFGPRSIIINEIMFDPPAGWVGGEYVELFNRGTAEVDLTGWALRGAVRSEFTNATRIPAGGFLVIAQDASRLREIHGDIAVAGNFNGRLKGDGETVRLVDAGGRLVNAVTYRSGGDWPEQTRGGGSSLELINPWMNNGLSSAWAASASSEASPARQFSVTNTYRERYPLGEPADYRELHLYLTGRGHVVLDRVELMAEGTNCLAPANSISTNGSAASGWLCQGTHAGSFMSNGHLHLVADGRGDNRANHVELDAPGLRPGVSCELRFNARWISGSPRLIAETWDGSILQSFRLDVPQRLGTPGRTNSRSLPATAPQTEALRHSPAVPRSIDTVRITAQVTSAAPLREVRLFHRPDSPAGDAPWQSTRMFDDGSQGSDATAGDGLFTADLAGGRTNGAVVQFFVRAVGTNGLSSDLPRLAAAAPALFVVDDAAPTQGLRTVRVVISARDLDALGAGEMPRHGFRFPRLSNHYFNATTMTSDGDVFYGAQVRQSGSPLTRDGAVQKLKLKLPDDHPFRGRTKFLYDDDAAEGRAYHNRVTRYLLYLLGAPVSENEFVRLIVNAGTPVLREEVEPIDNEFLDRNFSRGRHGELYRIDDDWRLPDAGEGLNHDANLSPPDPDNPGSYRHSWGKRTRETEDDYSHLIQLLQSLSSTNTPAENLDDILDARATLKVAAVRGFIGDWDSFTMQRGKNGYWYRPPDGGRFQLLHWDSDEGFITDQPLYGERIKSWVEQPRNERLFYGYLLELVKITSQEPARLAAWLAAQREATGGSVVQANYLNFFKLRGAEVLTAMRGRHLISFEADSGHLSIAASNAAPARLTGRAPFGVVAIMVEGHPEAAVRWHTELRWSADVRPAPGEQHLIVRGLNDAGALLHERRVALRRTNQ